MQESSRREETPQNPDDVLIDGAVVDFIVRLSSKQLARFPLVRRWEDTEDISQLAAERLIKAIRKRKPTDTNHVKSLAARHIRFALLSCLRNIKRQDLTYQTPVRSTNGYYGVEERALDWDLPAEESGDWETLHEAIAQLPENEREIFELMWYCEFNRREVAEWLGISRDKVQRRFSRAREKLMPLLLELNFDA